MALRDRVGTVQLIDARSDDLHVKTAREKGYDLNEGMLAIYGDKTYYGSDALSLISILSGGDSLLQRALSRLLRNPHRSHFLYPAMKLGRNLTLAALGRERISKN
jgi:hypothetical protein